MYPRDTTYRLAQTPMDYRRCHALMAQRNVVRRIKRPTIMAERGGALIGMLATEAMDTMIVCGPLVVSKDLARPAFVVIRLVELYEALMRAAGVRVFVFAVPRQNARWMNWLLTLGLEPWQQQGEDIWFWREVRAHGQ